jgi:hypothetical protein
MMPPASLPDLAAIVRALSDVHAKFVVVGKPTAGAPIELVVSGHPTNLEAIGRALDRLGAALRAADADRAPCGGGTEGPRRAVDPRGTVAVRTPAGDVDLVVGGPGATLYAAAARSAHERDVCGVRVPWIEELAVVAPAAPATTRMLGDRLLSLADELAQLITARDGPNPHPPSPRRSRAPRRRQAPPRP